MAEDSGVEKVRAVCLLVNYTQDLHLHIKWDKTTLLKSVVKIGVLQQVTNTESDTKDIAEWNQVLALALGFHGEVEV